jgi:hypothetical protein
MALLDARLPFGFTTELGLFVDKNSAHSKRLGTEFPPGSRTPRRRAATRLRRHNGQYDGTSRQRSLDGPRALGVSVRPDAAGSAVAIKGADVTRRARRAAHSGPKEPAGVVYGPTATVRVFLACKENKKKTMWCTKITFLHLPDKKVAAVQSFMRAHPRRRLHFRPVRASPRLGRHRKKA